MRLSSSKQNPHWSCPDGASHVELITIALNAQAWLVALRARNEGAVPSTHRGTTPTPSSPGPRIPHPGDGDASAQPAADAVLRRQPEHGPAWPAQPRPVPPSQSPRARFPGRHANTWTTAEGSGPPAAQCSRPARPNSLWHVGYPLAHHPSWTLGPAGETKATEARLAPHPGAPREPRPLQTAGCGGVVSPQDGPSCPGVGTDVGLSPDTRLGVTQPEGPGVPC